MDMRADICQENGKKKMPSDMTVVDIIYIKMIFMTTVRDKTN